MKLQIIMFFVLLVMVVLLLTGCAHKGCPPGQEEYPLDVCMDFSKVTAQAHQDAANHLQRLEYNKRVNRQYMGGIVK